MHRRLIHALYEISKGMGMQRWSMGLILMPDFTGRLYKEMKVLLRLVEHAGELSIIQTGRSAFMDLNATESIAEQPEEVYNNEITEELKSEIELANRNLIVEHGKEMGY